MLTCYVHNDVEAVGTCVGCGKFICENCNTELKGKNYCKKCVDELFEENQRKVEKLEDKTSSQQPMVFMNAGGGGGAASSSSAVNNAYGAPLAARYTKSKVVAGLLGILLGGIGAHKFYLGRWGMGLVYLLFSWSYIPSIIGFIEGIVYLFSNEENFARKHDKGYGRYLG